MFHALTGCDTVSSFVTHGKKTAWAVWTVLPELTEALLLLSSALRDIPDDAMRIIEWFVILLYDRTSKCTDIDKARRKLLARNNNAQLIPPIKAALEEHVKRAVYQGGHVWVRYCCQHQSSLHQPTEVGQGLEKDSTHLTGPGWLFTNVCRTYATTDGVRPTAYLRYDLFTTSVANL